MAEIVVFPLRIQHGLQIERYNVGYLSYTTGKPTRFWRRALYRGTSRRFDKTCNCKTDTWHHLTKNSDGCTGGRNRPMDTYGLLKPVVIGQTWYLQRPCDACGAVGSVTASDYQWVLTLKLFVAAVCIDTSNPPVYAIHSAIVTSNQWSSRDNNNDHTRIADTSQLPQTLRTPLPVWKIVFSNIFLITSW